MALLANNNNNELTEEKFREFVKQIGVEMSSWEKNGLWQLSALSPVSDGAVMPGFDDTSPEELRVAAYLGKTDATAMQDYQKMLSEKLLRHKQLRDAIRKNTPEALQVLKDIYYNRKVVNEVNTNNFPDSFNKSTMDDSSTSGIFGAGGSNFEMAQTSVFGNSPSLMAKPAQGSIFGGSSTFGSLGTAANTSASVFKPAVQQNTGLFGSSGTSAFGMPAATTATSTPSLFGTPKPTASVFGSSQATQMNVFGGAASSSTSLFGGTNNAPSSNVFGVAPTSTAGATGGNNSVFGSPSAASRSLFGATESNTSVFSSAQSTTAPASTFGSKAPVFGGNASFSSMSTSSNSSVFGKPSQSQPIFGSTSNETSSQSSIFGQPSVFGAAAAPSPQTQQLSVFGSSQPTTNEPQQTSSIFGGNASDASTQQTLFGGGGVVGTQQPSNVFGGSGGSLLQQPSSVFGSGSSGSTQQPSNVFGGDNSSVSAVISTDVSGAGTVASADPSDERYTAINLLSAEDLQQYQSEKFTYIPLMPPPKELCF